MDAVSTTNKPVRPLRSGAKSFVFPVFHDFFWPPFCLAFGVQSMTIKSWEQKSFDYL